MHSYKDITLKCLPISPPSMRRPKLLGVQKRYVLLRVYYIVFFSFVHLRVLTCPVSERLTFWTSYALRYLAALFSLHHSAARCYCLRDFCKFVWAVQSSAAAGTTRSKRYRTTFCGLWPPTSLVVHSKTTSCIRLLSTHVHICVHHQRFLSSNSKQRVKPLPFSQKHTGWTPSAVYVARTASLSLR